MCDTDSPLVLSEESETHFLLNQAEEVSLINVGNVKSQQFLCVLSLTRTTAQGGILTQSNFLLIYGD